MPSGQIFLQNKENALGISSWNNQYNFLKICFKNIVVNDYVLLKEFHFWYNDIVSFRKVLN